MQPGVKYNPRWAMWAMWTMQVGNHSAATMHLKTSPRHPSADTNEIDWYAYGMEAKRAMVH